MISFLSKGRTQIVFAVASVALAACALQSPAEGSANGESTLVSVEDLAPGQATAVFAMGCFWCAESDFEKVDGVVDVISGYTGGTLENPTYEQVTYNETGHYEAVLVTYDTSKVSYEELLSVFWKNVDPFDDRGQFCDKGTSYRAAVFPGTPEEKEAADGSKEQLEEKLGQPFVTMIKDRAAFYRAEDYHQDYYKTNRLRYNYYRTACGRDRRLVQVWSARD
ncbi:peptide-methionine (S)-S-oxide reductase MsrA [uncultured Erythrobacter sp.]|uniref:peptide-methionine (S)-S-oxide reductase MsrA n=1 Tax=uncultured Erythrobacter sp. TaxID=263913 RepID=UPI00260DA715|nr:peptide-methionine (S)-S-oxide reductase MsrA [uncultured Erythrobacter sp.]